MSAERIIRQVLFKGSHYERGLERGRLLRETLVVPHVEGVTPEFVRGCFDAAADAFPPAIEEFEGIVRGGGFDRQALMAYYFARIESRLGGCTMFAVEPARRGDGNGPIAGRNYDWAVSDLRWCELRRFEATGAPRCIGYTHHWAGCPDMLSENGLCVAIASLPPTDVRAPGVQWNIIVDMLAERCRTVSEAAEACARIRHLRSMSYLLADAGGSAGVVEATTEEVRFRAASAGIVVAANAPLGGKLLRVWTKEKPTYSLLEPVRLAPPDYANSAIERARRRIRRTEELLGGMAQLSGSEAKSVLADHAAPVCTGDHSHPDGAPWGTIWSGICEPASREFQIAPGLPCRNQYQQFGL